MKFAVRTADLLKKKGDKLIISINNFHLLVIVGAFLFD